MHLFRFRVLKYRHLSDNSDSASACRHVAGCRAVRPVAECACPVWYSGLTAAQTKALESLLRRAVRIDFPDDDY